MQLRRAARFIDPATIWQQLEAQLPGFQASELAEYHAGTLGPADMYLGILRATGERTLWLKTTAPQPPVPDDLSPALWVKKITYPNYTLLTVVLVESEEQTAFADLARGLLADLERAEPESCATGLLAARLRRWQPQAYLPLAV